MTDAQIYAFPTTACKYCGKRTTMDYCTMEHAIEDGAVFPDRSVHEDDDE